MKSWQAPENIIGFKSVVQRNTEFALICPVDSKVRDYSSPFSWSFIVSFMSFFLFYLYQYCHTGIL